MVELVQHKIQDNNLISSFTKLDEITLPLNRELIDKDIDKVKEMLKNPTNKYDKANLKAILSYLEKMKRFINEDGLFDICWEIKECLPVTYPIPFFKEQAYGIATTNYIELCDNQKIMEIDLSELAELISFEFMYRDLGETHEKIEELLSNCGIIGYEDASLLLDFLKRKDIKAYELSKVFKVDETPYYSYDDKAVIDYFHSNKFRKDTYRNVIDYSCRYAATAIANSIMKNASKNSIDAKALMVSANNITLLVSVDNDIDIKDRLLDEISIRTFGRNFLIKPSVEMF